VICTDALGMGSDVKQVTRAEFRMNMNIVNKREYLFRFEYEYEYEYEHHQIGA
jgi:hypothetical protein